ncbi:hypothetical protein [Lyngbya confervoides]|uniref:Uncharacterized protein n=1 Tax=Lyngbya confervoides BDU141951 TaxID=1574623 RepID=A0ABD4T9Y3_9CYAN|nr:hypothetical protein [Lyngbya confervoides]MCM1985100.1 hypothetical protein [Lyngbya confervoides BDU141951]
MGLMDKIKREQSDPSIVVPIRPDPLQTEDAIADAEEIPLPDSTANESYLADLEKKLAAYPAIASKKLGLRIEEDLLEEVQIFCKKNKITPETLFEALFTQTVSKDSVLNRVVKDAQKRCKQRTEAGNIRSMITKFKNIKDK